MPGEKRVNSGFSILVTAVREALSRFWGGEILLDDAGKNLLWCLQHCSWSQQGQEMRKMILLGWHRHTQRLFDRQGAACRLVQLSGGGTKAKERLLPV